MTVKYHDEITPVPKQAVASTNVDKCTFIDPTSYESADQALFAVAHEMNPQNVKLVEEIGEGWVLV